MFDNNTTYNYWPVLRYISTYGIQSFIDGGLYHGYFSDEDDALNTLDIIRNWLSEQDEFEWCEAILNAKNSYMKSQRYKTYLKTKKQ